MVKASDFADSLESFSFSEGFLGPSERRDEVPLKVRSDGPVLFCASVRFRSFDDDFIPVVKPWAHIRSLKLIQKIVITVTHGHESYSRA